MCRTFFVGGNWKMNGSEKLIEDMALLNKHQHGATEVQVVVAPPAVYIPRARTVFHNHIAISGQNIHNETCGAYTGEISAQMLKEVGADFVILGHSERRHIFNESHKFVAAKVAPALSAGLNVIICCGETLEEREADKTLDVVFEQLRPCVPLISNWSNIVIAYEPVWAIGTGKVATPEQAQAVHRDIRTWLNDTVSSSVAESVRIIYGGSVNAKNCNELAKQPDIDGFLVGGASLKPEFIDIVNSFKVKLSQ